MIKCRSYAFAGISAYWLQPLQVSLRLQHL